MNWPIQPLSSFRTVQTGSIPSSGHPTKWPVFSLGNVCSVRRGTTITQNQATPGEIPVVAGGLVPTYFHDTPNREGNVITVSASGASAGFVNYWKTPIFASDCSTVESESPKVSIKYVFHFLRRKQEYIYSKLRSGAAQPHVYAKDIAALKILLPPLPEQRLIAAILDQADALRTKRREALAQLNSLTQSIFIDMFGDLMTEHSQWSSQPTSNFVEGFESGKSVAAEDENDSASSYRVLKVSAVTSLEYKPQESKAAPIDYTPQKSYFVRNGDLLFSRANTTELIGATAYVNYTPPNLLLSDKLWRFVWHEIPIAEPLFVNYLFRQPRFRAEIGRRASGTSGSMKNISQNKVLSINVGFPPIELQRIFASRITIIDELKAVHQTALAELDSLFSSLQHRAFRGEL